MRKIKVNICQNKHMLDLYKSEYKWFLAKLTLYKGYNKFTEQQQILKYAKHISSRYMKITEFRLMNKQHEYID